MLVADVLLQALLAGEIGVQDHCVEQHHRQRRGPGEQHAPFALLQRLVPGAQFVDAAHGPLPELGVGPSHAAELPIVPDEAVDVMALLRGAGTESLEIFFGEGFKIGDVFAADDGGLRVDAGLQGILGRC